jgi:elongation factor P
MGLVNSSDFKKGIILEIDGAPWLIMECAFQTPSARGASTLTKIKIRNLKTGAVLSKSYRGGEMIPEADCEKRPIQFLYKQDDEYAFMDEESYEQFTLTAGILGDAAGYLVDGAQLRSMLYNGNVISVELPNTVELLVVETAPCIKGATAQAQLKPAILETGIEILVPPYLESGERVKVDTRDARFIERAK